MIKIETAFQQGKAFIPYITAGYPNLEATEKLIIAMAEEGADLIEIGIPFSDASAEGPVIQLAIDHALAQGIRTDDVFEMVKRVSSKVDIPLVFMTYGNIIYGYGKEAFFQQANESGISGVIVPDVPFEEKAEFYQVAKEFDISLISMIAPTSKDRIQMIAKEAEGFIYIVSSLGVTGKRTEITTDLGEICNLIREANPDIPTAIGFGVSNPEQAQIMAGHADGVIIGSAIVQLIHDHGQDAEEPIRDFTRSITDAISHVG